jgi:hypothetical protein
MNRTNKDIMASQKLGINKQTRNKMWSLYTKDVISVGLKSKISFEQYCKRMLQQTK